MPERLRTEIDRLREIAVGEYGGFPNAAYREVALTRTDLPAVQDAIDDLDTRLQPARAQDVRALLGWLSDRVAWPNELQDPAAAGRNAEILTEELAELPYEAVARVVQAYPKRNRFWPSALAELYEPAEAEARAMRHLRMQLVTVRRAIERGPDTRKVGNTTYHDPAVAERRRQEQQRMAQERSGGVQSLSDAAPKVGEA